MKRNIGKLKVEFKYLMIYYFFKGDIQKRNREEVGR